ncbi:MAG: alpha/beta hydrolase [Dehalococcoidia bacterium]
MADLSDISILDHQEISDFIFINRDSWNSPPESSEDHLIEINNEASISARFYFKNSDSTNILLFHANAELPTDYDGLKQEFFSMNTNLFVVSYRGYGQGIGTPTIINSLNDSEHIYNYFKKVLSEKNAKGPIIIMGKAVGSLSAVYVASKNDQEISGIITESSFSSPKYCAEISGVELTQDQQDKLESFSTNLSNSITSPALLIHGEADFMIPITEAQILFDLLGSKAKDIITIPEADHGNLVILGEEYYWWAIEEFIYTHCNISPY